MNQRSAVRKINKRGVLLTFPINNRKEPLSLWSEFFPRTKLRWEWDEDGDNHVFDLWHLMKRLSESRQVVYSKWYQGRATFFSRKLFVAMLGQFMRRDDLVSELSRTSRQILDVLEEDSPLSTKDLKKMTDLQGKFFASEYNRALKALFSRLLIVGFGEVDDGAFPSLAVGATKMIYEDLWHDASTISEIEAHATIDEFMPEGSLVRKYFEKSLRENK